ncbi:MAG: cbb3-type cytochrome oxidase subunit 3 [bacterium]
MDQSVIQSVWTVVVLVLFVGIVIWAMSPKRRKDFDEASRLPLEDDRVVNKQSNTENQHG